MLVHGISNMERCLRHWAVEKRHNEGWPYEIIRRTISEQESLIKRRKVKYHRVKGPKQPWEHLCLDVIGCIDVCPWVRVPNTSI